MIKGRTPLALELASRIQSADRITLRAFANRHTTLVGSSKGYSVVVRNLEGEVISSFDLPELELAHGDNFVLRGKAVKLASHRNSWQGITYNYVWEDVCNEVYKVELLLNDNVVGSKLIMR
jgi:hypothetical protein